jgi:hypothetical protein
MRRASRKGAKLTPYQYRQLHAAHRAARENPISWGGVLGVVLLGGVGAVGGMMTDRWLATHALTAQAPTNPSSNEDKANVDKASGITNDLAPALPMWSNWKRLAAGFGLPIVVIGVSAFKMPEGAQTALRSFGLGWGIASTAKLGMDLTAKLLSGKQMGERLFQNEYRASNLNGSLNGSYNVVAGFAGNLRMFGHAAAPQITRGAGACCAGCAQGKPCAKSPPIPPVGKKAEDQGVAGTQAPSLPAMTMTPAFTPVATKAPQTYARLPLNIHGDDEAAE